MKCPHCQTILRPQAAVCPTCGFNEHRLAAYLGDQWIRLERLTDTASTLRLEQRRALEVELDDFERQLPQCFIAVYIGPLPKLLNPVEMGMWLLNHGAYSTQQFAKRNEYGIVITLDPAARQHGISLGYALEAAVLPQALTTVLATMASHLAHNDLGTALQSAIVAIGRLLRTKGQSSRRTVEAGVSPQRSGNPRDFGLTPLRHGHKTPADGSPSAHSP